MKPPRPPFLEFDFYFANQPKAQSFNRLITALLTFGARFVGEGIVKQGEQIRDLPIEDIFNQPLEAIEFEIASDLQRLLADPDRRLARVTVEGASGAGQNVEETVTYISISPQAAHVDHHPFALWTEGLALDNIRVSDSFQVTLSTRDCLQNL